MSPQKIVSLEELLDLSFSLEDLEKELENIESEMLTQNFWLRANARRKNSPPPIPKSLMGEKDIEWLRSLVITVHQEFNHVWADVLNFADKRQKTLNEINELEKLRWKVV